VYATELVELQPKARVKGDVIYNAIEMHHGATVAGTLKHHSADAPKLALSAPAASAQGSAAESKKLI
jgi:cytoskeletal protein CcmA (bactofilin family)